MVPPHPAHCILAQNCIDLFISPLFNQVGQLRTSSHLQLRPGQDKAMHIQQHRVTHGINKHTVNKTVENVYVQHVQMR